MKRSSLEKLKEVLNSYTSDELYQCISSYPSLSGISVSNYLNNRVYFLPFLQAIYYVENKNNSSNDECYEINDVSNMRLAA